MINPKVDTFIEENNMTFLYLLLANLETQRLNNLPRTLKDKFDKKLTEVALEHVATGVIPDYIIEDEDDIDLDME
ncbi:MAG: hypothetical protein K8R90_11190 [Candidatus Cloacimonetes bacterium]|nr:hypothetical protein [Candidatus Cloacimonadota bacterium]